jgi:thymidylate synthase (FAD)
LSQIKVEYIDHLGDDLRVANIARVSFGKWKEEIDEKDIKLIKYLADHEHNSPFRHVQISVRCKAPVFLARQLVKHCVGLSWNEISRRYVDTDFEFYHPEEWRSRPEGSVKQGSGGEVIDQLKVAFMWDEIEGEQECVGTQSIHDAYQDLVSYAVEFYDLLIKNGVAPEMARMSLPQSMMVDWVWTGSLEAMYNVYRLRSGEGAQEEAKDFSEQLKQVIEPIFPNAWKALESSKEK